MTESKTNEGEGVDQPQDPEGDEDEEDDEEEDEIDEDEVIDVAERLFVRIAE